MTYASPAPAGSQFKGHFPVPPCCFAARRIGTRPLAPGMMERGQGEDSSGERTKLKREGVYFTQLLPEGVWNPFLVPRGRKEWG